MAIQFEHKVIRTPIDTFNIISAGGIRVGTLMELYGPQHSGKSAFAYQVAGLAMQDDPKAEVIILDPEASTDFIRLKYVFNFDENRTTVIPCPTLEQGYDEIEKACKESDKDKKLRIVIWDSIAGSVPKCDYDNFTDEKSKGSMFSGGISLKARVNAHFLPQVTSTVSTSNVIVMLVNQVRDKIGVYNPSGSFGRSGGRALEHAGHYRLYFKLCQKYFDEAKGVNVGTYTKVSVEKSKFGCTSKNIPIYIDDLLGGKIIPGSEILEQCCTTGVIKGHRKWYWFATDEGKEGYVEYRWDESQKLKDDNPILVGNQVLYERAIKELTKYYRCMSFTLDKTYELAGMNDTQPTDEDRKLYNGTNFHREPPLHFEDGTVRQDGRYRAEDLRALSVPDMYNLYKELVAHNKSLSNETISDDPTKQELINILIKYDLCVGEEMSRSLNLEGVTVQDVEDNNEES